MFFKTDEEKKSAISTIILFVIMILVMSIAIFPPEPPELEGGGGGGGTIALNFGFDAEGMGTNYTSPDPVSSQAQSVPSSSNENEILTSDDTDAVAIENTPKKDIKKPDTKKPDTKPEPNKTTTTTKPEPVKQPVRNSALDNVLGGDGNSGKTGNQGDRSGQLNNQGYDGSGGTGGGTGGGEGTGDGTGKGSGTGSGEGTGSGGGKGSGHGNYKLAGRKVTVRPDFQYKCNEYGTVVVEIYVDRTGKVVSARAGVKGTTNAAPCLTEIAKKAAMETRFESSQSAAEKQQGEIVFNFTLAN